MTQGAWGEARLGGLPSVECFLGMRLLWGGLIPDAQLVTLNNRLLLCVRVCVCMCVCMRVCRCFKNPRAAVVERLLWLPTAKLTPRRVFIFAV